MADKLILDEDEFKNDVFEIMLSKPEYGDLPDYYVKEIALEAVKRFVGKINRDNNEQ